MRITSSLHVALIPILTASAYNVMVSVQDLNFPETLSLFKVAAVDFNPTGLYFKVDGRGMFTLSGSGNRDRVEIAKDGQFGSGPGEFYWVPKTGDESKIRVCQHAMERYSYSGW